MPALILKYLPFGAIGLLAVLLVIAHARIEVLESRNAQQAAEYNARIADGVADAARMALQERDSAVRAERKRWEALVQASGEKADEAERERDEIAAKSRNLVTELENLYRSDSDAEKWSSSHIPDSITQRLRAPD